MITVSISINGTPIFTRTAVNAGPYTGDVEVYRGGHLYKVDTGETICHNRDDGAVALARMILDTIHEVR